MLRPALASRRSGVPRAAERAGQLGLAVELLALALLLGLALQLRLANPEHYTGSFDEGVRMEQLLLMEHGYRPFRDIYASQGPLLLDVLYPLYRLFGGTLGAARLSVSALSLAGLLGAWWSARLLHPLAGLGVAALLALSPGYLENSRLALAEVPSLAPCLWALGCALRWQRGGRSAWLCAAGLLATLGVLIKPMALGIAAPLAVAVLMRPRRDVGAVGWALVASAALTAVVLLALDPARVLEVLGGYRLGAERRPGSEAVQNWSLISKVLGVERVGFVLLAGAGALLGLALWPRAVLLLVAWPLAQLVVFLLYTDLADKHIVYLVPPLALLGGAALGGLAVVARRALQSRALRWRLGALAAAGAALVYLLTAPALWNADLALLRDADERARRDAAGTQAQAALMAALAGPEEFVLTDHPLAAFAARRLVPPWLVDTSGTRVDAGALTSEVAIREAERYRPSVVVTWRRRLGKLDGFMRWLERGYRLVATYPGSDPANPLQVYVRADLEERARGLVGGR